MMMDYFKNNHKPPYTEDIFTAKRLPLERGPLSGMGMRSPTPCLLHSCVFLSSHTSLLTPVGRIKAPPASLLLSTSLALSDPHLVQAMPLAVSLDNSSLAGLSFNSF